MTARLENPQWVCAWCARWNDPDHSNCFHCGRDIELPTWSRKPRAT